MNIFNDLKRYDPHQEYLRKEGITEEEYQRRKKQREAELHQKELETLGLTEEQYQKRKRQLEKSKKWLNYIGCFTFFFVAVGAFVLLGLFIETEIGKSIITTIGGIWIAGLALFILCMIFVAGFETAKTITDSTAGQILIAIIITVAVIALIMLFKDGWVNDAHRPDRF